MVFSITRLVWLCESLWASSVQKAELMTPISPEPRKAAHSICSALKVSRLLMGFVFVNMLPAAPDGFAR